FKNGYTNPDSFIFLLDWPYLSIERRTLNFGEGLFGITISQAVIYLRRYRSDKPLVQGVVWISLILDTFHFAMVADAIHYWYLTCRQPENYLGLLQFHWSLGASIIATYLITSCVQGLYIVRVYMLSGNMKLVYLLSSLSLLQLGKAPFVLIKIPRDVALRSSKQYSDLIRFIQFFGETSPTLSHHRTIQKLLSAVHQQMGQVGGSIELAATSLCDIAISISLWYYLHRNRSGFARTETVVKKLILYTVNIGLLTSGASSLTLILVRPALSPPRSDLPHIDLIPWLQWLALPQNFGFISLTLIRSKHLDLDNAIPLQRLSTGPLAQAQESEPR
ncbi:hypothetical protein H0H93_006019, partial [Arthromyces matolae]